MIKWQHITLGNYSTPCSLSTVETEQSAKKILFPNPVQNLLNIKTHLTVKEAVVYDASGRKIPVNKAYSNSYDISNFEKGIYFLNVVFDNGNSSHLKFFKK